jgi:hypothetical protein
LAANALIRVESTASSSIEPARGWSIARLGAGVAEYAKPSDDAVSAQNPLLRLPAVGDNAEMSESQEN